MDDVYKPNHLGKILIIGGLVLLLATFGLGGFMLVRGAAKVYTTIEAEGAHTLTVPNAGEYVLAVQNRPFGANARTRGRGVGLWYYSANDDSFARPKTSHKLKTPARHRTVSRGTKSDYQRT